MLRHIFKSVLEKRYIIKENICDGVHLLRNFYGQLFPINLPKLTTNKTLQQIALRGLGLLSAKLYTNPLKFHLSRRLASVNSWNLTLLSDNCNAS